MEYSRATERKHKYECPVEWKKPVEDHENCYFCLYKHGESIGSTTMVKPVLRQKTVKSNEKPAKINTKPDEMNEKLDEMLKCVDSFRSSFCYVCARFVAEVEKQYKITDGIKKSYVYCFARDIIQDGYRPGKIRFSMRTTQDESHPKNGPIDYDRSI